MPHSACVRCQNCDGFPCVVHGKSDAEVCAVRPALEHPNVTLLTNARAVKLETDPAGRTVTEVVIEQDGATQRVGAQIVVVACGAANAMTDRAGYLRYETRSNPQWRSTQTSEYSSNPQPGFDQTPSLRRQALQRIRAQKPDY